jgi:uncharacterized membrane protein (UPF0127 family)
MFTSNIDPENGLLMIQKSESRSNAAIHMFFVGMDLGVVWLNNQRKIIDLVRAKSWTPMYTPKAPARFILEVHPDRLSDFELGDELSFE